jgi:hypothetical protein
MRRWQRYTGEDVTEAEVLLRAAHFVDAGPPYVDAIVLVLREPSSYGQGHLASTQLLKACAPWLSRLAASSAEMAAAMRARADFLEHPEAPCDRCGHRNDRHVGHPCFVPSAGESSCLECRLRLPAEPVDEDPACE